MKEVTLNGLTHQGRNSHLVVLLPPILLIFLPASGGILVSTLKMLTIRGYKHIRRLCINCDIFFGCRCNLISLFFLWPPMFLVNLIRCPTIQIDESSK